MRERVVDVKPQNIDIRLPVITWTDTVVIAYAIDIFRGDTTAYVEVRKTSDNPSGIARVFVRTDTIRILQRDTLTVIAPPEAKPDKVGFFEKIGNTFHTFIVAVLILTVLAGIFWSYTKLTKKDIHT